MQRICYQDIRVTQLLGTEANNVSHYFFIGHARVGAVYHRLGVGEGYAIICNVGEE